MRTAGERVTTGQFVGLSGGDNGDHLHLETRDSGVLAVDPRKSFLVPSIAAYNGGPDTAEENTVDAADSGDANNAAAAPEQDDEGIAVTNEPVVDEPAAAGVPPSDQSEIAEPGNLLAQLLYEPDSPYGDGKSDLIGEMLATRVVTADDGSEPG